MFCLGLSGYFGGSSDFDELFFFKYDWVDAVAARSRQNTPNKMGDFDTTQRHK